MGESLRERGYMSRRLRSPARHADDTDPGSGTLERPSGLAGEAFAISSEVVRVNIGDLEADESPRLDGTDADHARALAETDQPLPPIIVHHATMRVIDGIHRVEAARMNGSTQIEARFCFADETDVFRIAVWANITHGLPLTRADRKAAVERILTTHPELSDRSIAHTTGLAARTVAEIRRHLPADEIARRVGRDGRERPLSTADGRRIALHSLLARPDASLREIAQEAGISVGTVRDVRARLESGGNPVPTQRRLAHKPASPGTANGRSLARQKASPVDTERVMGALRRDPALRYTNAGRALLRFLGTHGVTLEQVRGAIEGLPPHCLALAAKIAQGYAEVWNSIAAELDQRSRSE